MTFLRQTLRDEAAELDKNNVKLRVIGRVEDLPQSVRVELSRAMEFLDKNTGLTLVLALSYAGRAEILDAVRDIAREVEEGRIGHDGNIESGRREESVYLKRHGKLPKQLCLGEH